MFHFHFYEGGDARTFAVDLIRGDGSKKVEKHCSRGPTGESNVSRWIRPTSSTGPLHLHGVCSCLACTYHGMVNRAL